MNTSRILVIDDDDSLRRVMQVQLEQDGYSVVTAASAQQAFSLLQLRAVRLGDHGFEDARALGC